MNNCYDLINDVAIDYGRTIAEGVRADHRQHGDPVTLAGAAGFGTGVQFALELAQLDPAVALQLITAIHEDANAPEEWNVDALMFIAKLKGA